MLYPVEWFAHRNFGGRFTAFYAFEGYNRENGRPTRKTLEDMGLKKVADVLKKRGRLG